MSDKTTLFSEDSLAVKLALSEASLNDYDVIHIQLGSGKGPLVNEIESWLPTHDGKADIFIRENDHAVFKERMISDIIFVPDRIKTKDLNALTIIGNEIALFEIGYRVYAQTEKEFINEGKRIASLVGSCTERLNRLEKLNEEEKV